MRDVMEPPAKTKLLVCRAQGGDRTAFDTLIERYRDRLGTTIRAHLASHLRQTAEVEELTQETMTRAFRSLERFRWRGEDSFYAWLCAIARHVVLKSVATGRRYQALELPDTLRAEGTAPSKALRREERFDRLRAALDRLSPDHRQVVTLARIKGLPIKEIATRMNRSPGAVKVLLLRALRELKRGFGDTESLHLPDRSLDAEGGRDVD